MTINLPRTTHQETGSRRIRRAMRSDQRTLITKRTPFGRARVEVLETGEAPQDNRTGYVHLTKGRMDRRSTPALGEVWT